MPRSVDVAICPRERPVDMNRRNASVRQACEKQEERQRAWFCGAEVKERACRQAEGRHACRIRRRPRRLQAEMLRYARGAA